MRWSYYAGPLTSRIILHFNENGHLKSSILFFFKFPSPLSIVLMCSFLILFLVAMQQVLDNLTDLPPSAGAEEIDLIFLKGIMENPIVRSLAKVT